MTDTVAADSPHPRSAELFARAQRVIPGGVSSPVRAFRAVGGTPLFIARGAGAEVFDVDGKSYLDLVCSWGPLIAGHAHPAVLAAVSAALTRGTTFGAPCESGSAARGARGRRISGAGAGALRVLGNRGRHEVPSAWRAPTRGAI